MHVEKDYAELLGLFSRHKVKYCIVGAFAVGFYSIPRYTKDMDILVEPTLKNAQKIIKALKDFGFGNMGLSEKDFSKEGKIVQLGYEPVRVDIITSIGGCSFEEVWKNKMAGNYGKQKVFFIGTEDLIKAKLASNRPRDKLDLQKLRQLKKRER